MPIILYNQKTWYIKKVFVWKKIDTPTFFLSNSFHSFEPTSLTVTRTAVLLQIKLS